MKRPTKVKPKNHKPRRWYSFLWLVLPILAVIAAVAILFYIYIYPYSSKYGKTQNLAAPVAEKVDQSEDKLKLIMLSQTSKPTVGDEKSPGTDIALELVGKFAKPVKTQNDLIITLSSSSPSGIFIGGERVQLESGKSKIIVRYVDSKAGPVKLSAFASGFGPAEIVVNFTPGQAVAISNIRIDNSEASAVSIGKETSFSASVIDKFANPVSGESITWQLVSQNATVTIPVNADSISIFNHVFTSASSGNEIIKASASGFSQQKSFSVQ